MNKATFTRLINDSASISDADVMALEQVVLAFPYCHVGHMLLAKASSDRGSMLASQRLRKAAIHAPSRALLKKLIESQPVEEKEIGGDPPAHSISEIAAAPVMAKEELDDLLENDRPEEAQKAEIQDRITAANQSLIIVRATETELDEQEDLSENKVTQEVQAEEIPKQELAAKDQEDYSKGSTQTPSENQTLVVTGVEADSEIDLSKVDQSLASTLPTSDSSATETSFDNKSEDEEVKTDIPDPRQVSDPDLQRQTESEEPEKAESVLAAKITEQDEESSPQAGKEKSTEAEAIEKEEEPAPLAEVAEEARPEIVSEKVESEEFTPADPAPEPVRVSEEDRYLEEATAILETASANAATIETAEPEHVTQETEIAPNQIESLITAIFRESELGYAMASSRMGETLELKGDFTREMPFHFQPELLVEYQHKHKQIQPQENQIEEFQPQPEEPTPAPVVQQNLIDEFLKQAAKSRPRNMGLPKTQEQEDLSSKSTKLGKSLISENLAQIFASQGKTAKAIKIYQQLALKMPEKSDYFAAQILKLQNPNT